MYDSCRFCIRLILVLAITQCCDICNILEVKKLYQETRGFSF